jgi:hypothetical protein
MSAMNTVCPATVTSATSVPSSYLGGTDTAPVIISGFPNTVRAYRPSDITNPTFTVTSPGTGTSPQQLTKTARLFSVLDGFVATAVNGRYTPPTTGYWPTTQSQSLATLNQIQTIYTSFTTTNVPGQSYLIINPTSALRGTITGSTADATNSVSYDLLYSLQYEFCFWVKVYSVLLGDYVTVQNKATSANGVTPTAKEELQRKIINLLNAVNLRLSDLTEISNYVAQQQSSSLATMNTNVNKFLTDIQANTNRLVTNSQQLSGSDANSILRKRMLEFSEEKNNYANQLLTLYVAANFIALGLLFYIYRS